MLVFLLCASVHVCLFLLQLCLHLVSTALSLPSHRLSSMPVPMHASACKCWDRALDCAPCALFTVLVLE